MERWIQDPLFLVGLERLIWILAVCPAVYLALLLSRWMAPSPQSVDRRRRGTVLALAPVGIINMERRFRMLKGGERDSRHTSRSS